MADSNDPSSSAIVIPPVRNDSSLALEALMTPRVLVNVTDNDFHLCVIRGLHQPLAGSSSVCLLAVIAAALRRFIFTAPVIPVSPQVANTLFREATMNMLSSLSRATQL